MFKKLRTTIIDFVATLERLCTSLDTFVAEHKQLSVEQKTLSAKLDTLVQHAEYLATSEFRKNQRAGHISR